MAGTAEGSRSPGLPRGCAHAVDLVARPERAVAGAPAGSPDNAGDAPPRGGARTERLRACLRRDAPGARRSAAGASPPARLAASHPPGGPRRREAPAHDLGALQGMCGGWRTPGVWAEPAGAVPAYGL